MFNPLQRTKGIEKIVCRNSEKLYARFRATHFYGGIATADTCGCNILCKFCWAWRFVTQPRKYGKFYTANKVAKKLIEIAKKHNFSQLRITGAEPTLCKPHLLKVLELIPSSYRFILETNGILIGHQKDYAEDLARFKNLHVRVSLKGSNPEEFSKFTGAEPQAFEYQLRALENLNKVGIDYHPALAGADLIPGENIKKLKGRLGKINPGLSERLEMEGIIKYPQVVARLRKAGFRL